MLDLMSKQQLRDHLKHESRVLGTRALEEAFDAIDRKDFIVSDCAVEAYEDYPLPIGYEQTISQPTTVFFMLELLDVKAGNKVLDIGSGSGWTTALLSKLAGEHGYVRGVERIPELIVFGQANLKKYQLKNTEIMKALDTYGWPGELYDRILVSAGAEELPQELIDQLKPEGVMVIPVGDSILKICKLKNGNIEKTEFPGFVFVPLIKTKCLTNEASPYV